MYPRSNGKHRLLLEADLRLAGGSVGASSERCPTHQKRSWLKDRRTRCRVDCGFTPTWSVKWLTGKNCPVQAKNCGHSFDSRKYGRAIFFVKRAYYSGAFVNFVKPAQTLAPFKV